MAQGTRFFFKYTYNYFCIIVAIYIVLISLITDSHAAAWTLPKKGRQTIHSLTFYSTDEYYDPSGDRQSQHKFIKGEYSVMEEYGLKEGLTVGLLLNNSWQRQPSEIPTKDPEEKITVPRQLVINDGAVWLRKRLYQNSYRVLSLQPSLALPNLYVNSEGPGVNKRLSAFELRLLAGQSGKAFGKQCFTTLETGVKSYFDTSHQEVHVDATFGVHPTEKWMVMGQAFISVNARNFYLNHDEVDNDRRYDLVKLQLSAVRTLKTTTRLQMGVFNHMSGSNTGAGNGVVVSLWKDF